MTGRLEPLPPAVRWRPSTGTLLCVLAGVMLTTALPPQRGTSLLAVPALALFFAALRAAPHPGRAAFAFALGHLTPLLIWLFYLDPAKSIPTRALVPAQAIGAILFVALYYALFGRLFGLLRARLGPAAALPILPPLWLGLELLRGAGELGFPWCLTGAVWLDTPLQPLYAAAGELGLGAATALTAAALAALAAPRAAAAGGGLAVAAAVLWGGLWLGAGTAPGEPTPAGRRTEPLRVASVQADVAQADKWDDAKIDSTRIPYTELTGLAAAGGAELVVWAETAVPAYLLYERDLLTWVQGLARDGQAAILTGFPDARLVPGVLDDQGDRIYERFNAAGLFSADGALLDRYFKHHLVPLGEAMPFQRWLPWLGGIDVGQAEWTQGPPPAPLLLPTGRGEVPLIVLICFEAAFGDLARQAVRRGGAVLVNITNDGWFGHGAGPVQHAALSRIRAAECGVPLVRSANNGISMITDARGRVTAELGLHRRGVIEAAVPTVPRPTWYVRLGVWPVAAYLLLVAAVLVPLARRRGRRADAEAAAP